MRASVRLSVAAALALGAVACAPARSLARERDVLLLRDGALPVVSGDANAGLRFAVTDPKGNVYVLAKVCTPHNNLSYAVLRVASDGTLTHVAGRYQGTTADGSAATAFDLAPLGHALPMGMAVGGKAIFVNYQSKIVKVDLATQTASVIAGMEGGTTDDFKPAKSSWFVIRTQLAVHPDGHLLVVDESDGVSRVRMIWNP